MLAGVGRVGRAYPMGGRSKLEINFLSGRLDSRIAFSRASLATSTNSSGQLVSVASDEPRQDFNPVSLLPRGLLLEGARTNVVLNSAVLVNQSVTVSAVAHTLSFYGTGSVTLSGVAAATVNGTGVYPTRTTLTFTPTSGTLNIAVSGSVTMAQLEAGAFASSYIATAGTAVTRAADMATLNVPVGAAITCIAEFELVAAPNGGFGRVFQFDNGTEMNRFTLRLISTGDNICPESLSTGGGTGSVSSVPVSAGVIHKAAIALMVNDLSWSLNGSAVATDNSLAMPVGSNTLRLGRSTTGNECFVWLRRLTIVDQRLSNDQLQALSS